MYNYHAGKRGFFYIKHCTFYIIHSTLYILHYYIILFLTVTKL